jgi:predicted  nucleic acid-binding Zn-ribbon protein
LIGASGEREALAEQARLTGLNEELTKELELVKHEMEMHREDLSAAHEHHDARSQVASETISEHVSEKEVLGERLAVRKTRLFAPFYATNDHFTKTRSGQT